MAQDYDKIFKENFEVLIQSFARKMFHIEPSRLEEIPDDLQYTIEKKPDLLKKVNTEREKKDYILHIEAQSSDPHSMIDRMFLYYALLWKEYHLQVKQYVLYIGSKEESNMPLSLEHENVKFNFHLILMSDIDYEDFIHSPHPEDVIIAILCDFKDQTSSNIIKTIIKRLKKLATDELCLRKYLKQLEVLSKLRNLQEQTIKNINNMPLTYDLKTDLRYLAGAETKQRNMIIKMIKNMPDFALEQIAKIAEVPIEYVRNVHEEMKKDKK